MEPVEYERMDAAEDRLWWYRALHAQLLDAFGKTALPPGAAVLDAGCGTGGLLKRLGAIAPERTRIGLDHEAVAATRAVRKSGAPVVLGSVDALPFADASFGAIFSADVLYHREVDPLRAAREAYRCLMPEGMLVVNLPAFDWLASYHDRQVHGARRYNRAQVHALLAQAGFKRIAVRYWNSLLLPLMVLQRKLVARAPDHGSDVAPFSPWLDRSLYAATALERQLARVGMRFPAGGSILVTATRP